MPRRPNRPCNHPGCGKLTRVGHCDAHANNYDQARGTPAQRGYGKAWRKLRQIILNRDPVCRSCSRAASTDVDHIRPRSKGGKDDPANLQGLCHSCHSRKTASEDGGFGRGY